MGAPWVLELLRSLWPRGEEMSGCTYRSRLFISRASPNGKWHTRRIGELWSVIDKSLDKNRNRKWTMRNARIELGRDVIHLLLVVHFYALRQTLSSRACRPAHNWKDISVSFLRLKNSLSGVTLVRLHCAPLTWWEFHEVDQCVILLREKSASTQNWSDCWTLEQIFWIPSFDTRMCCRLNTTT